MDQNTEKTIAMDTSQRLTLENIVKTFQVGINEEQGWAVFHQALRCRQRSITSLNGFSISGNPPTDGYPASPVVPELGNVFLDKDGAVTIGDFDREDCDFGDEDQFLRNLACTVYEACQYSTGENEELPLSDEFSSLLVQLGEEGAGFSDDRSSSALEQLLKITAERTANENDATDHYQAVCRALLVECLDFSEFLSHVKSDKAQILRADSATGDSGLIDGGDPFHSWAMAWMQVIRDLRAGIRLRKVASDDSDPRAPRVYELTPFEMLMDDIRQRRFILKNTPQNLGEKQFPANLDAHDVILRYIRSRPPLSPVQNRRLRPKPSNPSVTDLLLTSIRQFTAEKLRKTPLPQPKDHFENYRSRRLFPPPPDDEPSLPPVVRSLTTPAIAVAMAVTSSGDIPPGLPKRKLILPDDDDKTPDFLLDHLDTSGDIEEETDLDLEEYDPVDAGTHTDVLEVSGNCPNNEVVSLTLDEIALIRGALAKNELENLEEQNSRLFDDIRRSKVCFSCRRVKFSQFTWLFRECGVKCHLCQNTVCAACTRKMVLPCDRLDRIPVHILSPAVEEDILTSPPVRHAPVSAKRPLSSSSTLPRQKLQRSQTHDFSASSTLPKPQTRQRPPLQRGLTMSMSARAPPPPPAEVTANSWTTRRRVSLTVTPSTSVVIQVCIECHSVLYHAIMESQSQLASIGGSRPGSHLTVPSLKDDSHGMSNRTSGSSMMSDSHSDSLDEDFEDLGDFLDEHHHHQRMLTGQEDNQSVSPANSRSDSTSSEAGSFYSNHI